MFNLNVDWALGYFLPTSWGLAAVYMGVVGWVLGNFLPTGWRLVDVDWRVPTFFHFTGAVGWIVGH